MTDEQLDALELKAKAATEGMWRCSKKVVFCHTVNDDFPVVCDAVGECDAAFIAAANPAAILELIAELRQARAERDWLASERAASKTCPTCPSERPRGVNCATMLPDEKTPCKRCWLDAAKEATCAKK